MSHKFAGPFEVPSGRPARGRIAAPPSKSHAIRLLVCTAAAGADYVQTWAGTNPSDDVRTTLDALAELHATWASSWAERMPRTEVLPTAVDVGASATAFRFLCALVALRTHATILTGDDSLRRRPMDGIVGAVRQLGVSVEGTNGAHGVYAPLTVSGGPPSRNECVVDASRSSHALSALLIVGPALPGGLTVRAEGGVASRPYVDLTVWTMRRLGANVVEENGCWRVSEGEYSGWRWTDHDPDLDDDMPVPIVGDWSSAGFLIAAGIVTDGSVEVTGLEYESPQADRRIVEILEDFGRDRRPLDVDLGDSPDLAPLVGALGCVASGTTRVRGAAHLRIKESDRIATVVAAARALGCDAREQPDGFEIDGPAKHGGLIETRGDHRIAMAFAVAGLAIPGVVIDDPTCVSKSYPGFWDDLLRLTTG